MARESLHAEVGNPNNVSKLPRVGPSLRFRTQLFTPIEDRRETLRVLARVAAYGACPLLVPLMAVDLSIHKHFTLSLVLLALFCLGSPQLRPFVVRFFIFFFASIYLIMVRPPVPLLFVPTLCALLIIGVLFRVHYVAYCRAGLGVLSTEKRRWRAPTLDAFVDAVVAWVCYNRHGSHAPGIVTTPAGSCGWRFRLTVIVLVLLGVSLPYAAADLIWSEGPPQDTFTFATPFVLCIFPLPIFLLACFLTSFTILGRSYALKCESESGALPRYWQPLLEHYRRSSIKEEAESLFMGQVEKDDAPLLVPLSTARRHIWAVGGTGSGKTTFLTSLVEQFGYRGDTSIIVGDLKADSYELLSSLQWVREKLGERAEKRRVELQRRTPGELEQQAAPTRKMPLWHLTNRPGCASHVFSLFHQPEWKVLSATQRTDVLMAAMALSYSRSFGESWYSDACYHLLYFVVSKYPEIRSFKELAQRIALEIRHAKHHELSSSVKHDGEHVRLVLERLASADSFHQDDRLPPSVIENSVQLGRVFREPCLMYCAFSSLVAPTSSPELLRVLVSALLTIGTMVRDRHTKVLLVLDEWQRMVAGNIELLLQQARSLDVTVVLANQTVADLKQGSIDLTSTVEGNTSIQAWFKDFDQVGMQQIQTFGGLTVETFQDYSRTESLNAVTETTSLRQSLVNRMAVNEIAAASSRQSNFIARIADNAGYAHYDGIPFIARYAYHLTEAEYQQRLERPWPGKSEDKIEVGDMQRHRVGTKSVDVPMNRSKPRRRVIGSGAIERPSKTHGRERKR